MEVCGWLHAPATLLEEQTPVPFEQEILCDPDLAWTFWRTANSLDPTRNKSGIIQRTQTSVSFKHINKQLADLYEYEVIMLVDIKLQTFVLYLHVVWLTVLNNTALHPVRPQPSWLTCVYYFLLHRFPVLQSYNTYTQTSAPPCF